MKLSSALSLICVTGVLAVTGCANTDIYSGNVYQGSQAKTSYQITYGRIVSARAVKIQANSSGVIGTVGGGVIGGIAGSSMGGGRGSDVLGAIGAVAGAAIGSMIEQKVSQTNSVEMVIRRDDNTEMVVVQKADPSLVVGARVRIVGSGSDVTVSAM